MTTEQFDTIVGLLNKIYDQTLATTHHTNAISTFLNNVSNDQSRQLAALKEIKDLLVKLSKS